MVADGWIKLWKCILGRYSNDEVQSVRKGGDFNKE